jgi:DNA-binding NarL/FixJ family response regulator
VIDAGTVGTGGIGVLIVDDQRLVRAGFRMLLDGESGITVVGEAADGRAAVSFARATSPDVVLMDIRMPVMAGIEATRRIAGAVDGGDRGGPRVLVLTTFDLDEYVFDAVRAGASGFLLKDTPPEELVEAVRIVARGDALLAPAVTRQLISEFARQPSSGRQPTEAVGRLTERELEVLRLVARGRSNAEIAGDLTVSETTVKTHVSRILAKLHLRDRVQAVVYAYEEGLVRPGA